MVFRLRHSPHNDLLNLAAYHRQVRNGLAHGKPAKTTENCEDEAGLKKAMRAQCDLYLNPSDAEALYIQVKALRTEPFKAAK